MSREYETAPEGYPVERQINGLQSQKICRAVGQILSSFQTGENMPESGISFEHCQFPTPSNNYEAITQVTIQTPKGHYDGTGIATPDDVNGSRNTQALVDKSVFKGIERASYFASLAYGPKQSPTMDITPIENRHEIAIEQKQQVETQPAKREYKHSTTKPASPKQVATVKTICSERDIPLEEICREYGVSEIGDISSFQANEIINTRKKSHR